MKTRFQKSQCNPLDIIGSLIDAKFYIETSFWKLTLIQYSRNIVIFSWLVHGRSLFADWGIWSWIIVPNVDFFINRLYFSFQYWNKCEIANFKYRCEKLVRVIGITALLVSPQCQVVSFLAVFPAHRDTTLSSRLGGVSSLFQRRTAATTTATDFGSPIGPKSSVERACFSHLSNTTVTTVACAHTLTDSQNTHQLSTTTL